MRILLVDDHAIVRRGLRELLIDELGAVDVGEASSAVEAVDLVRQNEADLAVVDLSMPGRSGLDAIQEMRAHRPKLRVLVLSAHAEEQYAIRALRAGAAGYVTKDSAPEELTEAIRTILSGRRYVSAEVGAALASHLFDDERPLHAALSDRELQVLCAIGAGRTVKEIAAELALSEKTVSTYRTRLLEKMQMKTTAELMRYALKQGLAE